MPPAPPAPPPSSRRAWIIAAVAVVVVVAVALTLVFTLGGDHGVAGRPASVNDARTVAQTFANLETERYNSGTLDSAPDPSVAAYAGVSCARDLAEMRGNGARPAPLNPPHRYYSFAIEAITAGPSGHQLLRIARTTLSSGDVGTGLFTLQRESGRWVVCGLFPDTEPADPTNGGQGSGGNGSAGSGAPGGGSGADSSGAGSSSGEPTQPSDLQQFLNDFGHAVAAGEVGTAAQAICTDDPEADGPIESWTSAHAQITSQVKTTGTACRSPALAANLPPTRR